MSQVASSTDDPLIGSTLGGRYRIEECVGAGAMGAVYRATQSGLNRAVALKVLKRDMAWGGDTVQRFRREAKAMSALHHPNTVRVFDFGATDDGLLYLAMELLEGEPVTELLMRTGPLDVRDAVIFAQEVVRSIGEAHAKGIVHRDLKPDNIFLARVEGRAMPMVKVLDFGIAKAIEGERKIDQFETLDGTVFGTPRYMSPEQASGKSLDSRSDLYAVGILLYEFLSGQPPFVDADAVVVMAKHIREQPVPLGRVAHDRVIPKSLENIVARALEKDPNKRFQSAEELERALEASLPDIERLSRMSFARVQHNVVSKMSAASNTARVLLAIGVVALLTVLTIAFLSKSVNEGQATDGVASAVVPVATDVAATDARPSEPTPAPEPTVRSAVVHVSSDPDAADVWRDGISLGVTPLDVVVPVGSTVSVSLRKEGFADLTVDLRPDEPERVIKLAALQQEEPKPRSTREARKTRVRRTKAQSPAREAPTQPKPSTPVSSPYEKF